MGLDSPLRGGQSLRREQMGDAAMLTGARYVDNHNSPACRQTARRRPLAKPEWGTKRQCKSCNAKFYDLQRSPIVCPKCNTVFELEEQEPEEVAVPVEAKADPVEAEIEEIEETTGDDGDDVSVLSDDDDDDPAGDDSTTVRLSDEDEES